MDRSTLSFIDSQMKTAKIFVVSKTSCKACKKAKKLLNQLVIRTGTFPSVFEVDTLDRKSKKALIKYLFGKTGIKTVPQIWVNGRFLGGNDDIQQLHREGRLVSLIRMRRNRPNRSPSPSVTLSVKSAPSPVEVGNRIGNNVSTRISYGRQRVKSDVPVGYTNSLVIPGTTVLPGKFSNVYGDEKWDMSTTNLELKSNYAVEQPPVQSQRNSYFRDGRRSSSVTENSSWLLTSAPNQHSFPEVRKSNWIESPGDFSGNASVVTTQGESRSKIEWFDGYVETTDWM